MRRINNKYLTNALYATDDVEARDNCYKYVIMNSHENSESPFVRHITFNKYDADADINEIDLISIVIDRLTNIDEANNTNTWVDTISLLSLACEDISKGGKETTDNE